MPNKKTPLNCALVIDDDMATCNAVSRIGKSAGFTAQAFHTYRAFHDWLESSAPDRVFCLVLNLRMVAEGGLPDVRHRVMAAVPRICIGEVEFVHNSFTYLPNLIESPALYFLRKPFSMAQLQHYLLNAHAEFGHIQAALQRGGEVLNNVATLTPRELEVCKRVANGLTNIDVAEQLGISVRTVKAHRGNVMRKLAADSLADLVRLFDQYQSMQQNRDGRGQE